MDANYEVIVIGAGPAGLTAGLYCSRAKFRTLILEKETPGGELMNRDLIENYPGYSAGISGPELGSAILSQVINYGTEIRLGEIEQIRIERTHKVVKTSRGDYSSRGVIIAGGAHPKRLGIPGEQEFADKGVFYCATCDGPRFTDRIVAVVGGGDSGITEGLFLARFVSRVVVIELLPNFTATKILQERAISNPKIELKCGTRIEAIVGDGWVKAIDLFDTKTGERSTVQVDGVLVHIGLEPNTDYLRDIVPLDRSGQILVNDKMETEIPGVFAAGDIRHNSPMQIATAVGDGATSALSLGKYLVRLG